MDIVDGQAIEGGGTESGSKAMLDPDEALALLQQIPTNVDVFALGDDDGPAKWQSPPVTAGREVKSKAPSRTRSPIRSPLRSPHRIRSPIRKRCSKKSLRSFVRLLPLLKVCAETRMTPFFSASLRMAWSLLTRCSAPRPDHFSNELGQPHSLKRPWRKFAT